MAIIVTGIVASGRNRDGNCSENIRINNKSNINNYVLDKGNRDDGNNDITDNNVDKNFCKDGGLQLLASARRLLDAEERLRGCSRGGAAAAPSLRPASLGSSRFSLSFLFLSLLFSLSFLFSFSMYSLIFNKFYFVM